MSATMVVSLAIGLLEAAAKLLPELQEALPALQRAFIGASTPEDIAMLLNTTVALENSNSEKELAAGAVDTKQGVIT